MNWCEFYYCCNFYVNKKPSEEGFYIFSYKAAGLETFTFCCQNLGLTHTETVFLFFCGLVIAVHARDTMFITWQRHFFRKQRPATGMAFGVLTFFDTVCYCCTAIKYEASAFPHTFFSRSFFQVFYNTAFQVIHLCKTFLQKQRG